MDRSRKSSDRATPSLGDRFSSLTKGTKALVGAIIAVGAIASAITAVGKLVPKEHDPTAEFADFSVAGGATPLSGYAQRTQESASAAGPTGGMRLVAMMLAQEQTDPNGSLRQSDDSSPLRGQEPTGGSQTDGGGSTTDTPQQTMTNQQPIPDPSTNGTDTGGAETDGTDTGTNTDQTNTNSSPAPRPPPRTNATYDPPLDRDEQRDLQHAVHRARSHPRGPKGRLTGCGGPSSLAGKHCPLRIAGRYVGWLDADGNPIDVSPVQAAARIVKLLAGTATMSLAGGAREPAGVIVSFQLAMDHCEDRRLDVRWSLGEGAGSVQPPSPPWYRKLPVLWLEAEDDHDDSTLEFWVPLPKTNGHYDLELIVTDEKTGKTLAHSHPKPLPERPR
jgi:hypothetical protein